MSRFDGVIEAVRYKAGRIEWVRAYERRGATYSDWVLLDRKSLLQRLKNGKRFVTGRRQELLASTFITDRPVQVRGEGEKQTIRTSAGAEHDELEGVPTL